MKVNTTINDKLIGPDSRAGGVQLKFQLDPARVRTILFWKSYTFTRAVKRL